MRNPQGVTSTIRRQIGLAPASADSEALLSEIMEIWGGPKELAKSIKASYDAAPNNSMIRQRYMEMVQRLIINNTKEELSRDVDPTEMSDEELADAVKPFIKQMIADGEINDEFPEGSAEDAGNSASDEGLDDYF